MSPVILLDAAASHVSATVTEIGKTVCIRKASRAEQDDFNGSSPLSPAPPNSGIANGFSPSSRAVEEVKLLHQKKASSGAGSRRMDVFGSPGSIFDDSMTAATAVAAASPPYSNRPSGEDTRRLASEPSSLDTNSPPSRSTGGLLSDDSTNAEESEDAWAELKVRSSLRLQDYVIIDSYCYQPYLEAQTESIVYAIQSVLFGVRAPTPSPSLNENLTQIITIVSSFVAVCNDNLPLCPAGQRDLIPFPALHTCTFCVVSYGHPRPMPPFVNN
jgi:hypothetical protein